VNHDAWVGSWAKVHKGAWICAKRMRVGITCHNRTAPRNDVSVSPNQLRASIASFTEFITPPVVRTLTCLWAHSSAASFRWLFRHHRQARSQSHECHDGLSGEVASSPSLLVWIWSSVSSRPAKSQRLRGEWVFVVHCSLFRLQTLRNGEVVRPISVLVWLWSLPSAQPTKREYPHGEQCASS